MATHAEQEYDYIILLISLDLGINIDFWASDFSNFIKLVVLCHI